MINMIKVWSMNVACFDHLCIHGLPWARPIDELLHQSQPRSCPKQMTMIYTDHPSATGHTQATRGTESDGRLSGRHAFEPATHVSIHVDGFSQCGFITWYCSCPRKRNRRLKMASRLFVVAGRQEYRQGDKRLSMIAPVIFWLEAKGGRSIINQIITWYLKPMPPMPWSVWNALKCVGYCLTCWFRPRQWSHRGGLVQAIGSSKGCQVQFYSAVSIYVSI
jgi:hypothetical protein